MAEAAGVELFSVLTTRNLLILGSATTAKKAPLTDPLYVYCTKMLFLLQSREHHIALRVSHNSPGWIETKHQGLADINVLDPSVP
jgi:hypothetical protein